MIMRKVKIKDIGNIITGKTPPTKSREYYGEDFVFIKPTYIDMNSRYFENIVEKVSAEAYEKYKSSFVPVNSICVVTIGSIGEKICLTKEVSLTNQAINTILPYTDQYDNMFVYYLLKYNLYRVKAMNNGTSSGRENVSKTAFENIEVEVPDLITQQKISKILSPYDDLIENNLKRIALLEETAESIYKEWFVNFRFPGYDKCEFINGIPNGWEKKAIKDIIMRVNRRKKIKNEEYLESGDIPVIDQSRMFIGGYTNDKEAEETNTPAIVFGDHTRIIKYIDFNFASGADGTQIIYSNSDRVSQQYLYMAIKNIDLSNYSYARHFKYLKEEYIYIPDEDVAEGFTKLSKNILCQVSCLREQIIKLKEARDILIPKLIRGEIEV